MGESVLVVDDDARLSKELKRKLEKKIGKKVVVGGVSPVKLSFSAHSLYDDIERYREKKKDKAALKEFRRRQKRLDKLGG